MPAGTATAGAGTGTTNVGTIEGSTGISTIATSTTVQTAWRTPLARTRVAVRINKAIAATMDIRSDASTQNHAFPTFFASRVMASALSTFSSTMPARNCSADPDQNRSMICRTAFAATLVRRAVAL